MLSRNCRHCCSVSDMLICVGLRVLQERAAALEIELRKSKRAEQKLQALLYRLRQDVAEVKQGAELLAKLEDQRSLEYEVDFLTNKVKVGIDSSGGCFAQNAVEHKNSSGHQGE